MAELAYSQWANYTVPDFSKFTFTLPTVSIPAVPNVNLPLPNITLPAYQVPDLTTFDFRVPSIPDIYFRFDPEFADIQESAFSLRLDLESLILNYQHAIDDVLVAKSQALTSLTKMSNFKNQLDAKAAELASTQTQLNSLKQVLDASNAAYQSGLFRMTPPPSRTPSPR
jgi:hypothetical protein